MAGQDEDAADLVSSAAVSSANSNQNDQNNQNSQNNQNDSTNQRTSGSPTSATGRESASPTNTGGGNDNISWGPAITATPLPTSQSNGDGGNDRNSQSQYSGSGLSADAKKVVICTTTIGGTLILALLIYAIWRRRKGASYSEIVRFRPHSSTVFLDQNMSEGDRLTALPIYRQERISIRSSRHESLTNLTKQPKRMAALPSSLRKEWRAETSLVNNKDSNPPKTPTKQEGRSFLHDATPPSKHPIAEPERTHQSLNRVSSLSLPVMRHSVYDRPTQPDRPATGHDRQMFEPTSPPHSPDSQLDLQHRWSWTNSQAPSTPRITAPTRTSLTSLRLGSVASWVRSQRNDDNEQENSAHRRGLSRPLLKNQALKPVLGPAPARRKLSKGGKHGRVGSLSSIFKGNPNANVPHPLSPRLEEQRTPVEQQSIEMTQKS